MACTQGGGCQDEARRAEGVARVLCYVLKLVLARRGGAGRSRGRPGRCVAVYR